ncbi:MucR family transcriptional regulator [Deferribacter abyssi]|uniref:MucR family transcriptional regulator n=1 Tax=Deferribacter abyssi TaxID=213806 RepID=UPI003C214617
MNKSKYYKNSKYSFPKYSDEHIDFIAECIKTMTDEEIYETFTKEFPDVNVTLKSIKHLINRFNLEKHCIPPNTDKPWELVRENKVQCAICGRWLKTLHGHVESKHDITISEYKEKFGINSTQPLCCNNISERYSKRAKIIFQNIGVQIN